MWVREREIEREGVSRRGAGHGVGICITTVYQRERLLDFMNIIFRQMSFPI